MLSEIKNVLQQTPGLTGREIAKVLGKEKKVVNSFLSKNSEGLYQEDWKWFLEPNDEKVFDISCQSWFTCKDFEDSYSAVGDLLTASESKIVITFPTDFKVLLVAGARIIALVNQLNYKGKSVSLNFENCPSSSSYLNRLGFFDHIHRDVTVLPSRPKKSKAMEYKGNSKNLVEIGDIDLGDFNEELPEELTAAFTHHSGDDYYMAAFTVFSELIGNVEEHSETPIPGFAALQFYSGKQKHIQTVISDHGLGLSNTLKDGIREHYPELISILNLDSVDSDLALIEKALIDGKLSRFGHNPNEVARGLGLKRSQDYALKYNAEITVRQESFLIKLVYREGKLVETFRRKGLEALLGTHVCFDFFIK